MGEQVGFKPEGGALLIFPPGTKQAHPLILAKSDGGYGYDSTDLAAIWYRLLERKADTILYVTDAGQAPHFELVFAAAVAAGWTKPTTRLEHVPFGVVQGTDGKRFKTRSGDTVRLVDLLDEAVKRMMEGTYDEDSGELIHQGLRERQVEQVEKAKAKGRKPIELSEAELQTAARVMGYAAVK